ncbi:MAG: oxidoreductase-like domain-containing protein [Pseudomonadota bacterium]
MTSPFVVSSPATPGVSNHEELPPKPEMPDCCGGGCGICVLEGYDEELKRWEQEVERILAARKHSPLKAE